MTVSYTRTVPEMAEHVGKDRPIMTVDAEDLRAFFGSLHGESQRRRRPPAAAM